MAPKATSSSTFRCMACGQEAHKWAGRCGGCGDWNTLAEELAAPVDNHPIPHVPGTVRAIGELDRTLGGGFTGASVSLIGGEPGVGKSTLLLQAAAGVARGGRTVLYVTAEESANQLKRRAERLDAICDNLYVLAETRLEVVLARLAETTPALVVVDSVHTLFDDRVTGVPGSVTQVREATNALVAQIFGIQHLSMLSGFVFFSHQIGSFLGAWLGAVIFDANKSYVFQMYRQPDFLVLLANQIWLCF